MSICPAMKRMLILVLTLILMSSSASAIKISTFNVQSGVGTTEGYWGYLTSFWKYLFSHSQEKIIETSDFINSENIDIITLTEIDGGSLRSQNINQVGLLSNLTALNESVFFASYKLAGVLNQGEAILTRYPIIESKKYRLPGGVEPRYLGVALLEIEKRDVTILVTHLSLNTQDRAKQIKYISRVIDNITTPLILSGDFNVGDESELALLNNTGLKRIENCKTYPSWKPERCEDVIFVTNHFNIKEEYILQIKISDHLPIIIEATFD